MTKPVEQPTPQHPLVTAQQSIATFGAAMAPHWSRWQRQADELVKLVEPHWSRWQRQADELVKLMEPQLLRFLETAVKAEAAIKAFADQDSIDRAVARYQTPYFQSCLQLLAQSALLQAAAKELTGNPEEDADMLAAASNLATSAVDEIATLKQLSQENTG